MKVVFLDVDGVLNCASRWGSLPTCATEMHSGGKIDPIATKRLKTIIDATGAKIVVSSTWRIVHMKALTAWLHRHGIDQKHVIGRTPHHLSVKVVGKEVVSIPRGRQIQEWLDAHPEVTRFVILDDDEDMEHLRPHLVKTTWKDGLLDEHVDEAIARLNAQATSRSARKKVHGGDDGGLRSHGTQS